VGRFAALALVAAFFGCSGRSDPLEGDEGEEGTAGESSGGTSGSGGAGGMAGTSGTGGVENGGSGGVIGPSTGGAGGAVRCLDCPSAEYGLVIEGDGAPYDMTFNGVIVSSPGDSSRPLPSRCPEQPLRGSAGGCSPAIDLLACEGPMNGPPCLELIGGAVRYVDRTGELWDGRVARDVPATTGIPSVSSGTLELELFQDSGERELLLTVRYTFCTAAIVPRIVC
ncbi:MAG TPA: hypothetical protein VFZ53_12195, partial [Polyangiaceae bacterium]